MPSDSSETVRVWLVERTYSDDEQNIIITIYATPDGERYYRQERALTSFSQANGGARVARNVSPDDLGAVEAELQHQYATEAQRMKEQHDPRDRI